MSLPLPTVKATLTACVPFSFERSISKVDSMASDVSCTPALLAAIIGSDPLMAAAVLSRARAAAPRNTEASQSLTAAITLLGMSMVQGVVRSVRPIEKQWLRTMAANWALANATATMLRIIIGLSREGDLKRIDAGTIHLCGLLHDLGSIMAQRLFGESYLSAVQLVAGDPSLSLDLAAKREFGLDITAIGTLIARQWRLPEIITTCIRYHPKPEAAGELVHLTSAVHISRTLVRASGFTIPGDPYITAMSEAAVDMLGLRYGEIESAIRLFHDEMDELEVYEGVLAH